MDLRAELSYNIEACQTAWQRAYAQMDANNDQKVIFDELKQAIDTGNPEGKYFFIDGPGGTGKTHLFNALLNYVRSRGTASDKKIGLAVAASGIAALLLEGGRTVHNRFGLGCNVGPTTTCRYQKTEQVVVQEQNKRADIIIWDEATMSSKYGYCVDRCLRDITGNETKPLEKVSCVWR